MPKISSAKKKSTAGDRKFRGQTLTILKQELQVLFRQMNRKHFDGVLPEPHIFADRNYEDGEPIKWYLWKPDETSIKSKGRPSIRLSYETLMTEGIDDKLRNDCLREYIHHWQHFTGKRVEKDEVFWNKARDVGYKPELDK